MGFFIIIQRYGLHQNIDIILMRIMFQTTFKRLLLFIEMNSKKIIVMIVINSFGGLLDLPHLLFF